MNGTEQRPVKAERLSFTARTVISLGLNVIAGVIFVMQIRGDLNQMTALVNRMEQSNEKRETKMDVYIANKDAKDATQDLQINTLENRVAAMAQAK